MSVSTRGYQPEDFAKLCEIDRLCFAPGIAYSPEDISIVLLEPGAFVVVGESNQATAGFILARRERAGRRRDQGVHSKSRHTCHSRHPDARR